MSPPQDVGDQALLGAAQPEADPYGLNASICTGGYDGSHLDTTETFSGGIFTNSHTMTGTRATHACGGTSTSAMAVGGNYDGTNSTSTEKLVGGSWASSVALPTIRYYTCGGGTVDDFLVGQGNSAASVRNTSLEFNGTSWTNSATLSWSAYAASMGGNTSSAVEFSGYLVTNTATYNGSSWTDATAMNTARYNSGGDGNITSAIAYSGANTQNCEKRDTTTWVSIGDTAGSGAIGSPVACGQGIGAICGWGKQGGVRITSSELYDGTAFASSGTVDSAREDAAGSYSA